MAVRDRSVREALQADGWLLHGVLRPFLHGVLTIVDRDLRCLYVAGTGYPDGATIGPCRKGLAPDLLIGHRLDELFPDEVVDCVRPFSARAFAGETVTFTAPAFGREYTVQA